MLIKKLKWYFRPFKNRKYHHKGSQLNRMETAAPTDKASVGGNEGYSVQPGQTIKRAISLAFLK